MKIYEVAKGTVGYVISSQSIVARYTTSKQLCFDREEVLMDAVIKHNGDTYAWCKNMEQKGYTHEIINRILNLCTSVGFITFERDNYLLMIQEQEVTIKC